MATSFRSRLANVERVRAPIEATRPEVSPLPDWRENVRGPVEIAAAGAGGALAAAILILASARPVVGAIDPQLAALAFAGGVGVLGFAIAKRAGLRAKLARITPAIGALLVAATLHNAVHSAPGMAAIVAGDAWTERVLATTEDQTIALASMSVSYASPTNEDLASSSGAVKKPEPGFGKRSATKDGEAGAMPKVRRIN